MTYGITGATGHLGRLVVAGLKGQQVVALVRSLEKAQDLGVEARAFDYSKPETLAPALEGIDVLLLISSSEVGIRVAQHQSVIEAAKTAGVGRIVYTSLLHADASPMSLAEEHFPTETALEASGLPYTILRNGWYTEIYAGSINGAAATGTLVGSAGEGRISSASRQDYAEAAVAALTGEGHENKIYELAGDDSFTLSDLAAEISRQTGREITYKNLPEAEYAKVLAGLGLPGEIAQAIAGWDVDTSQGALFDEGRELSRLIGRRTTPMPETVSNLLAHKG